MFLLQSFASKNSNYKNQIANKSQISIFNDQNSRGKTLFVFLGFGHWNLFDIWDLIF